MRWNSSWPPDWRRADSRVRRGSAGRAGRDVGKLAGAAWWVSSSSRFTRSTWCCRSGRGRRCGCSARAMAMRGGSFPFRCRRSGRRCAGGEEAAGGKIAHQAFVDRCAGKLEAVESGRAAAWRGHLVLDRTGVLLGDLGLQQVADDVLDGMLALEGVGNDLVIGVRMPASFSCSSG
jgi:hypothetical protein